MPANVAEAHNLLARELSFLYTKWNVYKRLFCTDDESVQLLNHAASFFFRIWCEVSGDDIILTVCRMTDPPTSKVKGKDKSNLTIEHLVRITPLADPIVKQKLNSILRTIDARCRTFREHRNRRIGHYDLETRLKRPNSHLSGIGINDADDALQSIADVLNTIERYYDGNQQPYKEGIYGSGNGEDLLEFIRRKKDLEQYFNQKEFGTSL
jgi:hypothetical protein